MALSKEKKSEVVAEVVQLLEDSRLSVFAKYPGTGVKALQQLRSQSRENGTTVRVIKNRLFKKALASSDKFKSIKTDIIEGQLLYAFNSEDEVAPAQNLNDFAKAEGTLEFVGALTSDGQLLLPEDIRTLASLPSKHALKAQLASTIAAPLTGLLAVASGNMRGLLNALSARAGQVK